MFEWYPFWSHPQLGGRADRQVCHRAEARNWVWIHWKWHSDVFSVTDKGLKERLLRDPDLGLKKAVGALKISISHEDTNNHVWDTYWQVHTDGYTNDYSEQHGQGSTTWEPEQSRHTSSSDKTCAHIVVRHTHQGLPRLGSKTWKIKSLFCVQNNKLTQKTKTQISG